jgi:Fur family peroxide stress response transcriptional regulator
MERDAESIQTRLEELKARCRKSGMNVTPQRIAVYRALLESEEHPTPEALFASVREGMPSISLATIYKTLEALQRLGVCHEISRLGEARRFEANLDDHHHTVCTRCGRVADFDDERLGSLSPPPGLDGFVPTGIHVQVVGLCGACAGSPDPDDEI